MQKRYVIVSDINSYVLEESTFQDYGILELTWLSLGKAMEIVTEKSIPKNEDAPYDIFEFGPQETERKKKFLFCDMDATILEGESLDEIAKYLPQETRDLIAQMTLQTMYGKVNLEESIRRRVSFLKDQPLSVIDETVHSLKFNKGARTLINTMKKNGATCILISSGFTHITHPVAQILGFDEDYANVLDEKDGKLTGIVNGQIIDGEGKGRIASQSLKRAGLNARHGAAVGDGSNDVYMLSETDMGIAYYAKPILKEKARLQINKTDLTSVLYAQGFKDEEINFVPD